MKVGTRTQRLSAAALLWAALAFCGVWANAAGATPPDTTVAVGLSTILTSPDGVTWTPQTGGQSKWVLDVAWDGTQFVAVGNSGFVITSPDGATWTPRTSVTTSWLRGVAGNGSMWVAVGDSGALLTSPDGITWTALNGVTTDWMESVAWNGREWVIVGGSYVLTSTDGVTWTDQVLPAEAVTWDGTQWVAVGYNGKVETSPDAITWTPQTAATTSSLEAVSSNGLLLVATGADGTILTSPDGVIWTAQTSGTTVFLGDVEWNGVNWVAVGGDGTILTSPDGVTWTAQTSGTTDPLFGVAAPAGYGSIVIVEDAQPDAAQDFVFTETVAGGGFSLDDDADPTLPNMKLFSYVSAGTYTVTQAAVAGWERSLNCVDTNGAGTPSTVDATTGTATINLDPGETVTCTYSNNTAAIVIVKDAQPNDPYDFSFTETITGGAFTLDDDTDPTLSNMATFAGLAPGAYTVTEQAAQGWKLSDLTCVDGDAGGTASVGDSSTGVATINVDPGETVTCTYTSELRPTVVVGLTTILTSPDTEIWTPKTGGQSRWVLDVAWDGNQFVAVGDTGFIITSPDGVTWTPQTSGTTNWLYGVAGSGSMWVAVGGGVTGESLLTSPDGVTWTVRAYNQYLNDVAWNGREFVVVGDSEVWTSSDGVGWELLPRLDGAPGSLAWHGTHWVAVGQNGTITTSLDSINWTAQASGSLAWLRGVGSNGSLLVAVGDGGVILTSPNAVRWTAQTSGTTASLAAVEWTGFGWVAVGGNGTILTSPDGVTWTPRASGTTSSLFAAAAQADLGSIVIVEDARSFSFQDLTFTETITGGGFSLDDDADPTLSNKKVFSGVAAGTYTVDQTFQLTPLDDVSCFDSHGAGAPSSGDPSIGQATINLDPGETVTCTFVNSDPVTMVTVGFHDGYWPFPPYDRVGQGHILTSAFVPWTGGTWAPQSSGTISSLNAIKKGFTGWVAVGTRGKILTSPSGTTWTKRSSGSSSAFLSDVESNGLEWVTVGDGGRVMSSVDGISWVMRSSGTSAWLRGIAWDGRQWVAAGFGGTILTSPDGSNWTTQSSGTTQDLYGVGTDGRQWVAVGRNGTILTSPDGIAWTARSSGTTKALLGLHWNGDRWIVVGSDAAVLSSPHAESWTVENPGLDQFGQPFSTGLTDVDWDGSWWTAVGSWGEVRSSADGINWSHQRSTVLESLYGVATPTDEGTIVIVKDTQPDATQDFGFSETMTGGGFTLDDDADATFGNSKVFAHLAPGSYSVTETAVPGWTLDDLTCVDTDAGGVASTGAPATGVATINLDPGEIVTCTYTSTLTPGLSVFDDPCVVYDSVSASAAGLSGVMSGAEVRSVQVTGALVGQGGAGSCVPVGASSVVFRVSSVDPLTEGNLRVTPAGVVASGGAGVVNYGAANGLNNANTVTIPVSAGGAVDVEANAGVIPGTTTPNTDPTTHVRLVVIGFYGPDVVPDLKFVPVNPCAVADSRPTKNAANGFEGVGGFWFVGDGFPDVDVVGEFPSHQGGLNGVGNPDGRPTSCGVPASADAVLVNVVAIAPQVGAGFLSVGTGGTNPIVEATTPFAPLTPGMANGATTIVNLNGQDKIAIDIDGVAGAKVKVRVEILGYYDDDPAGLDFTSVTPCTAFDSRPNKGATGVFAGLRQHGPSNATVYQISGEIPVGQGKVDPVGPDLTTGDCGVPADASAVLMNFEAVNAVREGNFWVSAADQSTTGGVLNFTNLTPKMNNANTVVVPMDVNGQIKVEINAGSFTPVDTDVAHARGIVFGYYN